MLSGRALGLLAGGMFDLADPDATGYVGGAFGWRSEDLQFGFGGADSVMGGETGQRECGCKAG